MSTVTTDNDLLSVFPQGSALDEDGHVLVGGRRLTDLATEFGTPCYVVAEDALRRQARAYRAAFAGRWPDSAVLFASKSFPCTGVYRVLAEEGLHCDVAGPGELEMALAGGFAPQDICLHGNAKSDAEILRATEAGVGTVVIDNEDDIERLERLGAEGQKVLLRVIPEISVNTHSSMVTGERRSRFGLPYEQAKAAIARLRSSRLDLVGLHCHIGSQVLELESFSRIPEALARYGEFPVYNLGGGLGVRYSPADTAPSVEAYAEALTSAAKEHLPPGARLLVEPGRSLVARSTVTLYTVTTVKRTGKTFVAVDGGMADNLEPVLLELPMSVTVADRVEGPAEVCDVVGRHCESGDRLVAGARLAGPRVGDVLAVPVTGAYTHTLANNYNGALKPPVVLTGENGTGLVLRRETMAELMARDLPGPARRADGAAPGGTRGGTPDLQGTPDVTAAPGGADATAAPGGTRSGTPATSGGAPAASGSAGVAR